MKKRLSLLSVTLLSCQMMAMQLHEPNHSVALLQAGGGAALVAAAYALHIMAPSPRQRMGEHVEMRWHFPSPHLVAGVMVAGGLYLLKCSHDNW